MNMIRLARSGLLRAVLSILLVAAAGLAAAPPAAAQNVPVTTTTGTLPGFTLVGFGWRGADLPVAPMNYTIVMPQTGWNGVLLMNLDGVGGYTNAYNRGYAALGISRIAFNQGGRDSRVSAMQILQVLDIFTQMYGKPQFAVTNGSSTGGLFAGYMLENFPDRIDGAVSNCTAPGYLNFENQNLNAAWAAEVLLREFFVGEPPPLVSVNANQSAAWNAAINAAQATPHGRARIAMAVAMGQMDSWNTGPRPNFNDVVQVQAALAGTLRSVYGTMNTHHNQELQVDNLPINWTTGYDYAKVYRDHIRTEQRATIEHFYALAGLDINADLEMLNRAPRIAAHPEAVREISLHGDYTGNPTKPYLIHQLIGDPLVTVTSMQGNVDKAIENGKGHLVRFVKVDGTGHCSFRPNETLAAIETMRLRLVTGEWPDTSAAAMNARALALNLPGAPVPRYLEYDVPPFYGWFGAGDVYNITGCADFAKAAAAPGQADRDPRFYEQGFAPGGTGAKPHFCRK